MYTKRRWVRFESYSVGFDILCRNSWPRDMRRVSVKRLTTCVTPPTHPIHISISINIQYARIMFYGISFVMIKKKKIRNICAEVKWFWYYLTRPGMIAHTSSEKWSNVITCRNGAIMVAAQRSTSPRSSIKHKGKCLDGWPDHYPQDLLHKCT